MIGILCSKDKKKEYIEQLYHFVKEQKSKRDESIIVFAISDIDFNGRKVNGSIISEEVIKEAQLPLPPVIFNMALQRDNPSVKGRKILEEMRGIKVINPINRYDQWMIMELLSASKATKSYVLPYHIYDKKTREFRPEENKSYITMPSKGAKLSRVIYAEPEKDSDRVGGTQYFKKGHICDYIDASLCQKRWIFIEIPELIVQHNHPVIARVYLQKSSERMWRILGENVYPDMEFENSTVYEKLEKASLIAVKQINNYVTALGYCFMDFIIDTEGNPYFLHLGGITQQFFSNNENKDFYKDFYRNLLNLAGYYSRMHKED
jgi:hypothetical protein